MLSEMATKLKPEDITNSDKQILLNIYARDPLMIANRMNEHNKDTFNYSYISGIVFMFSVMGLIIYANFHYDIKLSLIKCCIRISEFRVCCLIPWLFEFPTTTTTTPPSKAKSKLSISTATDQPTTHHQYHHMQMRFNEEHDMFEPIELVVGEDQYTYPIVRVSDYSSKKIYII